MEYLPIIATLALIIVLFDGAAKAIWRKMDTKSHNALKRNIITGVVALAVITPVAHYLLDLSWTHSALLASLTLGLSHPLALLLPLLIAPLNITSSLFTDIIQQISPVLLNALIGIGTGIFTAIILFKVIKYSHTEKYAPLASITAAALAYTLSEMINGSGAFAVVALALFLANTLKEIITLPQLLMKNVDIPIILLAALTLNLNVSLLLPAFVIFIIYAAINYKKPFSTMPAAVIFFLGITLTGIETVISTAFIVLIYGSLASIIRHTYENYHR